jgi:hypothetical protein
MQHRLPSEPGLPSGGPSPRGRTTGREGCLIGILGNIEPILRTAGIAHPVGVAGALTAVEHSDHLRRDPEHGHALKYHSAPKWNPATGETQPPEWVTFVAQRRRVTSGANCDPFTMSICPECSGGCVSSSRGQDFRADLQSSGLEALHGPDTLRARRGCRERSDPRRDSPTPKADEELA